MRSVFSFLPVGDTLVVDKLGSQGLFFWPGLHSQTVLADAGATATAHMAVAATKAARTDLRTGVSSASGGSSPTSLRDAIDWLDVSLNCSRRAAIATARTATKYYPLREPGHAGTAAHPGLDRRTDALAERRLLPPREDVRQPVAHPVGELGRALLQERGDALARVGGLPAGDHRPRV